MKRTSLLSAALIAFALPLAAQDAAPTQDATTAPAPAATWNPGENFIANWDYDGDGTVTVDEVKERRGDLFASFDENEDGNLTPDEFAVHDQMRDAMQEGMDRPWGDGQPPMMQGQGWGPQQGWGQMQGRGQGWGRQQGWGQQQGRGQGWGPRGGQQGWGGPQMQQPGYGYGGPGRMGPMQQQGWGYGPRGGQMMPGYGPQGGPMMQGYGPQGMPQGFGPQGGYGMGGTQQEMAMLDANRDGVISEDEFVSAGEGWFARFDRNGDGVVTEDDFAPMMRR